MGNNFSLRGTQMIDHIISFVQTHNKTVLEQRIVKHGFIRSYKLANVKHTSIYNSAGQKTSETLSVNGPEYLITCKIFPGTWDSMLESTTQAASRILSDL